jgi:hypothetical protein
LLHKHILASTSFRKLLLLLFHSRKTSDLTQLTFFSFPSAFLSLFQSHIGSDFQKNKKVLFLSFVSSSRPSLRIWAT